MSALQSDRTKKPFMIILICINYDKQDTCLLVFKFTMFNSFTVIRAIQGFQNYCWSFSNPISLKLVNAVLCTQLNTNTETYLSLHNITYFKMPIIHYIDKRGWKLTSVKTALLFVHDKMIKRNLFLLSYWYHHFVFAWSWVTVILYTSLCRYYHLLML